MIQTLVSLHPASLVLWLRPFPLCLTFTLEAPEMSENLAPGRWGPRQRRPGVWMKPLAGCGPAAS